MVTISLNKQLRQAELLKSRNHFDQAILVYEQLLNDSELTKDQEQVRKLRLVALAGYGRIQHLQGRQPEALAIFQQRLIEAKTQKQRVNALVALGDQHNVMAKYEDAFAEHAKALATAKRIDYAVGRALALRGIGQTYSYIGQAEEAISNLKKALSLFQKQGNIEEATRTLNILGITHAQQGEVDKAIAAFSVGLKKARKIDKTATASFLSNLGEMYQDLYHFEEAIKYHREGLEIAENANLRALELDLCRNLGIDLCFLDQPEAGYDYLERALSLSRITGMFDLQLQTLFTIGMYEVQFNDFQQAETYGQQLLTLSEEKKARGHQARAKYLLGKCAQKGWDYQAAHKWWQQALFLAHETQQYRLLWQIHAGLAKISEVPELAATHNRIAAEVIEQIAFPIQNNHLRNTFLNAPQIQVVLREVR